jgi:hypothetical protein
MIPGHGADPQTSPIPYSVTVSKLNPTGGENVHFTLNAPNGESFMGK